MHYISEISKTKAIHRWSMIFLTGLICWAAITDSSQPVMAASGEIRESVDVLLFTKTSGFRHAIIEFGSDVIVNLGEEGDFKITSTEDAGIFTDDQLAGFKAIIFFNTSNDVLNEEQKEAFQKYIRNGGGFVGIHQGITTHQEWDWFLNMVGGGMKFDSHPGVKEGVVIRLENGSHSSTVHMPDEWTIIEEIHNYTVNPRLLTNVLLNVDESSYEGGNMGDHPISWYHEFEGGRIFCTGLGHTEEIFEDELFQKHLIGGIRWAAELK